MADLFTEPPQIYAGDTARWLKSLPDYPASEGWVLSYLLVSAANQYTITGSAQGDDHLINVSAATTAAYVANDYDWRSRVSFSGEVFTISTGRIKILPTMTAAVDLRSSARTALEAVNAVLENRATSAVAEYQIAGRQLKYIPIPELLALRSRLQQDVRAEEDAQRAAAGLGNRNRIHVRFGA